MMVLLAVLCFVQVSSAGPQLIDNRNFTVIIKPPKCTTRASVGNFPFRKLNVVLFYDDSTREQMSYDCWDCTKGCTCQLPAPEGAPGIFVGSNYGLHLIIYGCGQLYYHRCLFFESVSRHHPLKTYLEFSFHSDISEEMWTSSQKVRGVTKCHNIVEAVRPNQTIGITSVEKKMKLLSPPK